MKNKVIAYFKHNKITKPFEVDQLIISAFIYKNNISLKNNKLIKSYLITSIKKTNNKLFNTFLDLINNEIHEFNFEELIKLFEYVISPSDRIVNGAVYTPENIRTYITNTALKKRKDLSTIKIADISCGCGGFLFNAAQNLKKLTNETYKNIFEKNIFG